MGMAYLSPRINGKINPHPDKININGLTVYDAGNGHHDRKQYCDRQNTFKIPIHVDLTVVIAEIGLQFVPGNLSMRLKSITVLAILNSGITPPISTDVPSGIS
ncbi:hypothetical protein CHS0354_034641 [Potamilus streckersoni]|uniref:Uncharacterized protein n=1 Tax=Potamilus streckersoni TaxID=2493646 RepID=A0AAE0TCU6_9BIVA|nr:hypothetical protein CHS0354_034641 [Potamilus streckersoni]